ncbi:MAG: transcription-repair coupling factor [Verrucomicrobiales bacterium]|nr:transcription-repair coupling factor [Verrucomicrobiales bacterium]|tara:strand:- start:629 stop:931 length:303 start_codon:yes stop_codon:yes gene_type:complete
MIRHSVYFWLDDSLSEDDAVAFEGGLRALFEIDVVSAGSFGRAAGTPERAVTHNSFDYALVLEFEDIERHNAYQIHPEHEVFVEKFSQWFKEVRVFDTQF